MVCLVKLKPGGNEIYHLCHLVEDHVLGEAGSADHHRVIEKVVGNLSARRNALTDPLACVFRDCERSGRTIVMVLLHNLKFVDTGEDDVGKLYGVQRQ